MSGETTPEKSPFLLPTYQGVLNQAIQNVVTRFVEGSIIGTWIALEALFTVIPPKCQAEVEKEFEEIKAQANKAMKRNRNTDPLVQESNQSSEITEIHRERNRVFFQHIMLSLHSKGYLEKQQSPVPVGSE